MTQTSRRIRYRPLHGILLLDKARGPSSNQALQRVRRLFQAEKAGHTGSLDPLATGLLPVCFGEATKIAGGLLGARKAYETVARLGVVTDTDDAEGEILRSCDVPDLTLDQIQTALAELTGHLQQVPPIYSALKRGGEPLYAKARRGEAIDIAPRAVDVHAFELVGAGDLLENVPLLRLHVECGSGTYVRSLVRDLGEKLGCGAHVAELRRLWVDPFREPRMWTYEALQDMVERGGLQTLDACLLPIETGLTAWPEVTVTANQALALARGQRVEAAFPHEGEVAIFDKTGKALGLGWVDETGTLKPKRLFVWTAHLAKTETAQPGV
ncbi:tRNA pseudouridine(55) synthase TruB [Lysobacter soyae]|uniref:tRNA pseudouridine synthase B n=1 Tax=Lysobacter soyae TaxID=2764185 RepID=A0ABX8WKC0_9GAMM|nr:tRNA pseudouridine(55) synthase TruB [Lysobacter sp. CJ11]QYR52090.1 tRNA pseudouridine(55) synthase TruB [Lysobacter sp. CJ11]